MLIDWFTVVAQIVNFLMLVALMKHFLYGPLLARDRCARARIAAQLAEADRKSKEAEQQKAQVRDQIAEHREPRSADRSKTRGKRPTQRERDGSDRARVRARDWRRRWREDLRREETAFFDEIRRAATAEILGDTRHALADLAGADIERSAVEAFLEKLRSFDAGTLQAARWRDRYGGERDRVFPWTSSEISSRPSRA